jgi:integrase/recombinase XerC
MSAAIRPSVLLDLFLAERRAEGVSLPTLTGYRWKISTLLNSPGFPADAAEIAAPHIHAWMGAMWDRGLKAGGVRSCQVPVWAWLRWLFENGYIADDLSRRIRKARPKDVSRPVADREAFDRMLAVADSQREHRYRDVALLELFWSSGLRRGEVPGLQLGDVDLDQGTIAVLGKGGSRRVSRIGVRAALALRRYLVHERGPEDGPLFYQRQRLPMTNNAIRQMLRRLSERAGVHVTSHQFRRAAASNMLAAGMDESSVARQLGHSTLTMTLMYGESGRDARLADEFRRFDARR